MLKFRLTLLVASSNWSSEKGHFQRLTEVVLRDATSLAVTNFSHGFFGLRDDHKRNESTEFVMCLLFFAEARFEKIIPRKGNTTVCFQYCTTEFVGVLSRFRCPLPIHGRCAEDPTSFERAKTLSYMRSNDDFRFHFQYTSTTIGGLVEQLRMVALVPKVPFRKEICPKFVMVRLSTSF